jgi:competence protein ComEA
MKMSPFTAMISLAVTVFTAAFVPQVVHLGAAMAIQNQPSDDALPDAPGKAVVGRVCTACHGVDYIVPSERTVPVWRDTFELMKGYGAQATDDEWQTISDYIMANVAYLSVNKATTEDLVLFFEIDEKVARGVLSYRDKQGGFKTTDDLKKAPGLDATKVDTLERRLIFESGQ